MSRARPRRGQRQRRFGIFTRDGAVRTLALMTLVLTGAVGTPSAPARGQVSEWENYPSAEADSVRNRPRPEYDPIGVDARHLWYAIGQALGMPEVPQSRYKLAWLGAFELSPKFDFETTYDDNVFRDETNTVSDVLFSMQPRLRIASDWANHRLTLDLGGNIGRHKRFDTENFADYDGTLSGGLDITEDARLRASVFVDRSTESRASLDDLGSTRRPVRKFSNGANINFEYDSEMGLLRTDLSGTRDRFLQTGDVDNSDRDEDRLELTQRVGYAVHTGTVAFIEPAANLRQKLVGTDRSGVDKDSKGYRVLAGFTWDVSGVTFAEVGVGWQDQKFDDPILEDISGLSYRGRVLWNATDLLTLDLNFGREVGETTARGQSGIRTDRVRLNVDYSPFYNVILELSGEYKRDDFRGEERTDDNYKATGGVQYLINNYLALRLRYDYDERSSTESGESFTDNRVTFTIAARI